MAIIDYKILPFYLHHNFEPFYKNYIENKNTIEKYSKEFLSESIRIQKEKESYIYDMLGLDQNDKNSWKKIGEEIFGITNISGKKKDIIQNKLALFLKAFTNLLNNEIDGSAKLKNYRNNTNPQTEKELKEFIDNLIDVYNDPISSIKKYMPPDIIKSKEDVKFLEELFQKYRSSDRNDKLKVPNDKDNKFKNITEIALEDAIDFVARSSKSISNIIGDVGEGATKALGNQVRQEIIEIVATSILGTFDAESEESQKRQSKIIENVEFYKKEQNKINEQLKSRGVQLSNKTKDGLLEFGFTYTTKDTGTLIKNLKADEIFEIEIKLKNGEVKKTSYGVSSKTSWTENKTIKIYSGSFYSALENLFKSAVVDAGNIGEVINFLIYTIYNSLGVGTYGSIGKEKEEFENEYGTIFSRRSNGTYTYNKYVPRYNKKGQEITPSVQTGNFFNVEARPLFNLIIQNFAYQWLTGGISEATHADFFSLYTNEMHYFVPMSIILESIQDIVSPNKFLINQDLLPERYSTKSPIELSKYENIWRYEEMEELGLDVLSNSGVMYLNKNKLFTGIL